MFMSGCFNGDILSHAVQLSPLCLCLCVCCCPRPWPTVCAGNSSRLVPCVFMEKYVNSTRIIACVVMETLNLRRECVCICVCALLCMHVEALL